MLGRQPSAKDLAGLPIDRCCDHRPCVHIQTNTRTLKHNWVAKIDAGQLQLTGVGGFVPSLIKAALERGLQAELTEHLGYEKGDPDAKFFENSRNGTTPKTMSSEIGQIDLDTPRDRVGSFIPRLVPLGSRRLGSLDDMIISLYAGGMTIRDIQHHLVSTIGTELSHETISKITDEVLAEVLIWQRRPLAAPSIRSSIWTHWWRGGPSLHVTGERSATARM